MKKIILTIVNISLSTFVFAQKSDSISPVPPPPPPPPLSHLDYQIIKAANDTMYLTAIATIVAGGFIVLLVISLTKFMLDHKLKNKIIDKGISEQLAISILEKNASNNKDESIKWALVLLGIGIGAIISFYTMPLNIHSLAIMAISIATSQLGYFYYLKNQNK